MILCRLTTVLTRLALLVGLLSRSIGAQAPCYEEMFQPPDSQVADCFGLAFDVVGDVMVVGAPFSGVNSHGGAYVFERTGGQWIHSQRFDSCDPMPQASALFGISVATDGTHVFVQNTINSSAVVPPGGSTVCVYEKQAGTWVLVQRLYDAQNGTGMGDNFGLDIEVTDRWLLITNAAADTVHVFEKTGGLWTETSRITEADLGPYTITGNATFGYNVAADGDRFAVTHRGTTNKAHVFEFDGTDWLAVGELEASVPQAFDRAPVDLAGGQAFIGSSLWNQQAGSVWVFSESRGSWAPTQTIVASDSQPLLRFGESLSVNGDVLAVGAPAYDFPEQNVGKAYLFELDPSGSWLETEGFTADQPLRLGAFGGNVAIVGRRLFASTTGHLYAGRMHELRVSGPVGSQFGEVNANSSGLAAGLFGMGSSVIDHNCLVFEVEGLPPNQFGYFLMSLEQGFLPLFGGSQGNLHLGLPIVRFNSHILLSGPSGKATFVPDLSALPQGVSFSPGDTWSFQMWFRDANPGQTSNTTNGLAVTFETTGEPAVQFPASLLSLVEDATQIEVDVTLSQVTFEDVVIPYSVSGSATYNIDWRIEEVNPIVMPAGETSVTMTLVIAEDSVQEPDETAIITLGTPSGGVAGTASTFKLTIVDDD